LRLELEWHTTSGVSIFNSLAQIFSRKPKKIAPDSSRAERGQFGEDLAADYCRRELGFKIISRNWRWKRDELDLICLDGEVLVFVEVRARAAQALVSGVHSVTSSKKKALLRACKAYINQLQNPPKHVRFDVVDVSISDDGAGEVRHYSNIPLFSKHYTTKA
jgi:putative endonuclease